MPLGTGNSFARDLQINASVAEATATIRQGQVRSVDVSVAHDRYFLNVATIGLTTKIAEALTGNQKRILGRAAYLVAFCKGMARIRPFQVRLETDHGVTECSALQVVIGNGRYHGGPFPISPQAQITDGNLNVYVVEGTRRRTLLKAGFNLMAGRHVQLEEVTVMSTSVCRVTAKPRRKVTIDGEVAAMTPLEFRVLPGGLRCVVPAKFDQ